MSEDSNPRLSPEALRELCNRSFYHFVRIVNAVPPGVAPISKDIHKPLCDFFQDKKEIRKAIAMPRDWLKSTVYTKWGAIWRYLQNNEERILIAAENVQLAGRFLHWIEQQLLTNRILRKIYPELHQIDNVWTKQHRWSSGEADLPRTGTFSEPTFTVIGVGGAAQSGHYTSILIDDLVGKKALESPLVMETVMRWFDNVNELLVQPDKTMPDPSAVSIHGTFWFPGDFFCYIQERYPDYKFLVVPCQKTDKSPKNQNTVFIQNNRVDIGESNWPEQFPTQYYLDMIANPAKNLIYWAQHMNSPEEASDLTRFDTAWLKYFRFDIRDGKKWIVCDDGFEIPLSQIPLYGFIDPGGFSEKRLTKRGSRSAILIGGQPTGSYRKFVTYTWAGKFKEPSSFLDEVFKAHEEMKPHLWRQEIYAQQRYILKDIKEESVKRKVPLRIIPLEADERKDSKDLNIDALKQPMFNGEIFIHRSMKELIGEVNTNPNGLTRDLLDLLGQINKTYWKRGEKKDVSALNERNLIPSIPLESRVGY